MTDITVRLSLVSSSLSGEELSAALGPDSPEAQVRVKGEPVNPKSPKSGRWADTQVLVESVLPSASSLQDHLDFLFSTVRDEILASIRPEAKLFIEVGIFTTNANQTFSLTPDCSRLLARHSAALEVTWYPCES